MLYMVYNAFEVDEVVEAARQADPKVFISISSADRANGNYTRKPID